MREDDAEELVHAALLVDELQVLLEHLQETQEPRLELLAGVPRLPPSSASSFGCREIPKSIRLAKTMIASKMLKPSEQYIFSPRPSMLSTISRKKSRVKIMLAIS